MLSKVELAKRHNLFSIKASYEKKVRHPDTGDYSDVYTNEIQGYDYELTDTTDDTQRIIEAAARPGQKTHIMAHIVRLAAHKPIGNKDDGDRIAFILEDLAFDLADCSEFAVAEACTQFRKDKTSPFFPSTAELIERCEEITEHYGQIYGLFLEKKQAMNDRETN